MSELRQFRNLSSWREDTITVGAKDVGTCDFLDTYPNQFAIQNPNNTMIYMAIAKTPNEKNYEHRMNANSNDVFGRPTPTNKIMFYNPSDRDIVLKIFSIFQPFDLMTLKNMTANIEHATVNSDGIVHGFDSNVSVPSGDNLIGRVKLEDAKDYDEKLGDIETKLLALENQLSDMNANIENTISAVNGLNLKNKKYIGSYELFLTHTALNNETYSETGLLQFEAKEDKHYEIEIVSAYCENNTTGDYLFEVGNFCKFYVPRGGKLVIGNERALSYNNNYGLAVDSSTEGLPSGECLLYGCVNVYECDGKITRFNE